MKSKQAADDHEGKKKSESASDVFGGTPRAVFEART
jgi:hypothetical protein